MNYQKEIVKQGITAHLLKNSKFKTNLLSVFLTLPLERENVTKNALIAAVLRRGTANMPTQEDISKKLQNMYGAEFNCGVEKSGDNYVLKFYLQSISDAFLPKMDNNLQKSLDTLLEIVFNPALENGHFVDEYVNGEKENLKQIINSKIDDKNQYAFNRCIEEMYKNEPYGLYKYGYVEDLEKIDSTNLYNSYIEIIKSAKIDIFISGNFEEDIINKIIQNNEISKLMGRTPKYIVNKSCVNKNVPEEKDLLNTNTSKENDLLNNNTKKGEELLNNNQQPKIVTEKLKLNQGKLMLGLKVENCNNKYACSLYNMILGGSATSKLFQNVREKASLAYTASSRYIRVKDSIIVRAGIEINNYEKALNIIEEQFKAIKQGDFTAEDIENSKKLVVSTVGSIPDSQDSEITYYFGQELSDEFVSIEDYIQNIQKVQKEEIVEIANKIKVDTIYFLRN